MKVIININWSTTKYYEAGHRFITVQWQSYSIYLPRQGETMNIPKLLGNKVRPEEMFRVENTTYSIFEWVEDTMGWSVRNVHWDFEEKDTVIQIHVTDGVG